MQQDTTARRGSLRFQNTPEGSDNSNLGTQDGRSLMKSRNPKCALCQNHGNVVGTKFHKRYCPWKDCTCKKCEFIKYRRKVIAAQIADRRKMIEDREREREKVKPVEVEKAQKVDDKTPSPSPSLEKRSFVELKGPRKQKLAESCITAAPLPLRVPIEPILFRGELPAPVPVSSSSQPLSTPFLGNLPRIPGPHNFLQSSQPPLYTGFQSVLPPVQTQNRMFCFPHQTNYPIYRFWDNFGGDFKLAAAKIFEARYGPRPRLQVEDNLRLYSAQRYAYPQLPTLSNPQPPSWNFHNRLL